MSQQKFQCNGCGRNCYINLEKEKNRYYIEGNICYGGEYYGKEKWTFLKNYDSLDKKIKKKNLLSKLFGK